LLFVLLLLLPVLSQVLGAQLHDYPTIVWISTAEEAHFKMGWCFFLYQLVDLTLTAQDLES